MVSGNTAQGDVYVKVRRLGNSGLKVSVVGLGCNNFGMRIDQDQTQAVVDAAIDAGITLFDTADVYGGTRSEEFLGKALGTRRHDIILATKFGSPVGQDPKKRGGSRKWSWVGVGMARFRRQSAHPCDCSNRPR